MIHEQMLAFKRVAMELKLRVQDIEDILCAKWRVSDMKQLKTCVVGTIRDLTVEFWILLFNAGIHNEYQM